MFLGTGIIDIQVVNSCLFMYVIATRHVGTNDSYHQSI